MEGAWNRYVKNCTENPFFLSGFIKQFMEFNQSQGWTPTILVFSANNTIVGIAPLRIKKKFGVRFAKFLSQYCFSPDFVNYGQHREICISLALDFLFRTSRCQFVDLILPTESPNLQIIEQKCRDKRIHFCKAPKMGYCVVPTRYTWDKFKTLRGRGFRRKFKRIERHLDRAGSWKITCVENGNKGSDAFKQIVDVEKMSWKEALRIRRREKMDQDLLMIWKESQYMTNIEPDFNWSVWLLELNERTLSYVLVLQYKGVAYLAKTSYDERYSRFFPGIYIQNAAIRELFNKGQVRKINFLTDFPFMRTWTSLCLPRVRVLMLHKSVPHTIVRFALSSKHVRKILASLSKKASSIGELIGG